MGYHLDFAASGLLAGVKAGTMSVVYTVGGGGTGGAPIVNTGSYGGNGSSSTISVQNPSQVYSFTATGGTGGLPGDINTAHVQPPTTFGSGSSTGVTITNDNVNCLQNGGIGGAANVRAGGTGGTISFLYANATTGAYSLGAPGSGGTGGHSVYNGSGISGITGTDGAVYIFQLF